jgi:hypothetical protein
VVDESLLGYRGHNCAALGADDDVQKPGTLQRAIEIIVDEAELAKLVYEEFDSGARRPHICR